MPASRRRIVRVVAGLWVFGSAQAADLTRHPATMLDTISPTVPRGFAAGLPRSPLVDVVIDGHQRFSSVAEARRHCPGDTVVAVEPFSTVYRIAAAHEASGTFMCKAAALGEGDLPR